MNRLFLACTPRTGNVWFRKLVANALKISETAAHTPAEIQWQALPARCIVAMHIRRRPEFAEFLSSQGFTPIVTVRHPLDVLLSILHFSKYEPSTARWLEGIHGDERTLSDADPTSPAFLQYALSERAAALLAVSVDWLDTACAAVRYEELVANPLQTLERLLVTLGETAQAPLPEVIENHTIPRLRPLAQHHFWRGIPGLWRDVFTREYRQAVYDRHETVFRALGYNCECPTAPTAEAAYQKWQSLCVDFSKVTAP